MGLAFDASSLILLQEVGLLQEVAQLRIELATTAETLHEVRSATVHGLVRNGTLKVLQTPISGIPPELRQGLGEGEMSILALAAENRSLWAVLDEKLARQVAVALKIRFLGTARLIKHLADKGIMSIDRAQAILESLPRIGFFIEPATIREVLEERPLDL